MRDGHGEYFEIKPQRPPFYIINIVFYPLFHQLDVVRDAPQAVYLGPTCHTRLDAMTLHVDINVVFIVVVVIHGVGPWANKRHSAL